MKSWNFGIVILAPSKFHDVESPSFLQKSWNREFEAQTRKLGIVILTLFLSSPPLRIPKFPIPIPAPSAPCKHRIPKFPIPISAPYRHALNAWVSPLATCALPKGVCYLLTYLLPIPAPSAPCKPRIPKFPMLFERHILRKVGIPTPEPRSTN